jgi:hypothetical protein
VRQEPDTQVEVVDGRKGELTVLVDGREVARKGEHMPTADQVRAAVARPQPAPAG